MTILICACQRARLPLYDEGMDNHEVSPRVRCLCVSSDFSSLHDKGETKLVSVDRNQVFDKGSR